MEAEAALKAAIEEQEREKEALEALEHIEPQRSETLATVAQ